MREGRDNIGLREEEIQTIGFKIGYKHVSPNWGR